PAVPAPPAPPSTPTSLGARLARPFLVRPAELLLLHEAGDPGFDLLLERHLGLPLRPFRLGREEVGAERGLARLHPPATRDIPRLTRAAMGPGPLALLVPFALPLSGPFALARGFRRLRRAPPVDVRQALGLGLGRRGGLALAWPLPVAAARSDRSTTPASTRRLLG